MERVLCPCGNISSSLSISMMVALTGNVAAVIFCFFVLGVGFSLFFCFPLDGHLPARDIYS